MKDRRRRDPVDVGSLPAACRTWDDRRPQPRKEQGMTEDDTLREAIARWLWAMDAIPGAAWDEWPDEHAEYLSKADSYVADLPWLTPLRAQAAAADRVRELVEETWADPFGQWTAEQATAARQQKRETLRRIRRRAAALSDRPDPRRC